MKKKARCRVRSEALSLDPPQRHGAGGEQGEQEEHPEEIAGHGKAQGRRGGVARLVDEEERPDLQ